MRRKQQIDSLLYDVRMLKERVCDLEKPPKTTRNIDVKTGGFITTYRGTHWKTWVEGDGFYEPTQYGVLVIYDNKTVVATFKDWEFVRFSN